MKLQFGGKEYEIEEKIVIYIAIAVVCVIAYLFVGGNKADSSDIKVESINIQTPQVIQEMENSKVNDSPTQQRAEIKQIRIYIKGCVKKPGVYYLEKGSLVIDAIEAAGGLSKGAREDFNLVWEIKDNCMINIPRKGEKWAGKICSYSLTQKEEKSKKRIKNKRASVKKESQNAFGLININKASKSDLMTLNGVGEIIAQRIIEYRKSTKFSQVEDLKNVSGIGDKTFENMRDFICVK